MRSGALAAGAIAVLGVAAAPASAVGTSEWRVTISNLTPAGSQPFTEPLLAVHSERTVVWRRGRSAGRGIAELAEDGSTDTAQTALRRRRSVHRVSVGGSTIPPGATRSFTVTSRRGFDRLSVATMLVNTNDGFTGVDSLRLPRRSRTVRAHAYDAGSERNNESVEFIPGPCCDSHFARDPERRRITRHGGILGVGDIDTARYGWNGPAARITVRRLR